MKQNRKRTDSYRQWTKRNAKNSTMWKIIRRRKKNVCKKMFSVFGACVRAGLGCVRTEHMTNAHVAWILITKLLMLIRTHFIVALLLSRSHTRILDWSSNRKCVTRINGFLRLQKCCHKKKYIMKFMHFATLIEEFERLEARCVVVISASDDDGDW